MPLRSSLLCLPVLACYGVPAHAEDGKLEIQFELRARAEAISGQFRPNTPPDDAALLFRTRISADYDAGPIRIGGEIVDSRVYFERTRSSTGTSEVNTFEPVQAYVATDLDGPVQATFGRFTLNLGSRRLVARNAFRNTTNAFTGLRVDLARKDHYSATAFWTLPQQRLPDDRDGIRDNDFALDRELIGVQFFGGTATKNDVLGGTLEVYLYRLHERDSVENATRDRRLWTPGARVFRAPKPGIVDFDLEAAFQGGQTRATSAASDRTDLDVSAGFVHAGVGRTFAVAWAPRIAVGFDYTSGDGPGARYTRFDTLFGARVFDFGPSSLYGAVSRANIVSPLARLEVTPDKKTDGYVALRPLWLANAIDSFGGTGVRDPRGSAGRYAGTQIDIRARRTLSSSLRAAIGAALLLKGRFLNDAANAPSTSDTGYGFAELTANF